MDRGSAQRLGSPPDRRPGNQPGAEGLLTQDQIHSGVLGLPWWSLQQEHGSGLQVHTPAKAGSKQPLSRRSGEGPPRADLLLDMPPGWHQWKKAGSAPAGQEARHLQCPELAGANSMALVQWSPTLVTHQDRHPFLVMSLLKAAVTGPVPWAVHVQLLGSSLDLLGLSTL